MQLKKIRHELGVAGCALLQVPVAGVNAANSEWDIDTAVLYYAEGDGRVSAFEPAIYAGKDLDDGGRIDLRLVLDVLTGATPNGAHASSVTQTFTTPSGQSSYTAQPGETPLDDSFKDTRLAGAADWTLPVNRLSRVKLGLNASREYDYTSLGASATYLQDFNGRNTTLSAGLAFNNDTIRPVGGVPTPLSPMRQPGATNRVGPEDTKTVADMILGLTQIISRHTLVQLNYSLGLSDGYLTDPYKIVTVVNPVTGLPDNTALLNVNADALPYVYEKRPDSRQINSVFFRTVHHFTRDVINFSYRYFWDDWGITSNTFDLKYRYEIGRGYLQPQVRYYLQEAADFYRHNLVQGTDVDASGAVLLDTVSSDYRLAKMTTTTLSLKYGHALGESSEWSIRAGLMNQSVDDGDVPAGEETPDTDAIILNAGYSFFW
ncbi:MAG: DUF3570 domain-containing protein [Gammaproteobacteria bacterium]|nr:DUF3570 domain-containing protein [Gammaproteobacteria bacterium]